ncbi:MULTISPECIES: HDIG domain-containing metalloprotein [unclassified Alteromonas]|uniref:HDIG domain-containing metalloprotein n=1 Tax=unclassified Alteromonas TaxID=2614992 RepID=UPI001653BC55|nr:MULTISPECIES: HDIG domain-containing metalloprotein [unclassified Alteromonas]MBC6987553.1 HDIG domain-containing protein [Alteromonas sp. BZK5]MCG7643358.1 HDIG domain-containing protein [Alteromonas sp. MmMcT2-2]MCG7651833.1 HDIG domain-containing protein [Alteromonas sp. MmMcT2-5]
MKIDSLQPELSEAKKLARFKGFYCMAGLVAKLNQHGKPYWVITLMDAFTEFEVIATQIDCDIKHFSHFGFVHVEAKKIKTTVGEVHVADFIYAVDEIPEKYRHIRLIPKDASVNHEDMARLVKIVESIEYDALKHFVAHTLLQSRIMVPFLRNPASLNYHHNYVGGLLKHSIRVAELFAENMAGRKEEKALGIVGALLHDIGKSVTLSESMNYTTTGTMVNHDSLTLELCSLPLYLLSKTNPRYADILRHIWTCEKEHLRYSAKLNIATQIQRFDREDSKEQA